MNWAFCLFVLSTLLLTLSQGLEVRLGSRLFYTATDAYCPNSDGRYNDTKDTGSYLFSIKGDNYGHRVMSTDILTDYWKPSGHNCYRAHPTFMDCIQDVLSDLKTARKRAIIISAYTAYGDLGLTPTTQEIYASTGTAARLMFEKSVTDDIIGIAEVVLRHCPSKFERIQRNLGIIMESTTVHIHMTGPDDPPVYTVDGYSGLSTSAFRSWAYTKIDAGQDYGFPNLDCSNIATLSTGQSYPTGVSSAEEAVGDVDVPVTRENLTDYLSLVQFQRHDVEIVNSERTALWCGLPSDSCVDCRVTIAGNQADQRCANRLMTPRLNTVLNQLQVIVENAIGDSLKINQAFDEDRDGYTASSSLYTEGRAAEITLSSSVSYYRLQLLARSAVCSHADYVYNNGLTLYVAVRKMAGETEELYDFPETELMRVLPPSSKTSLTEIRNFDDTTNAKYPLFDSSNQDDIILDDYATIGMFKSPSSRYFRISPYIIECFSSLQSYYVEWENRTLDVVTVNVERAFLTTEERDVYIGANDPRYLSPILGLSMELSLNVSGQGPSTSYPLTGFAKLAIVKCSPIFQLADQSIGIGIYSDRIYIDIRDELKIWNPSGSYPTAYPSVTEYIAYLTDLYAAATELRMVDPDYPVQACAKADPPSLQDVEFSHTHSLYARHSQSNGANECSPAEGTDFCTRSETSRLDLFEYVWAETQKMHVYHHLNDTRNALAGCLADCGTCMEGYIYWDKIENCNNFIHWCPFKMIADGVVNVNLFPRDNGVLRTHACNLGEHCIERSALFLLFVDTVEAYYRPDASESTEEELFPQTENPSPLFELLHRLYAYSATGIVRVWVKDENDLMSMASALEAAMLYNTGVTEVKVYVQDPLNKNEVTMRMRRLITRWTTEGCTEFTREYVAPFSVHELTTVISKRSADHNHNIRDELIHAHLHREESWASRYLTGL